MQLSVAVGSVQVTLARLQEPASALNTWPAGHGAITGASVSFTVTVNVQALVLLLPSIAVQVTVVTPLAKVLPLAGAQDTLTPPQRSVAIGAVQVTLTRLQEPASTLNT